MNKCMPIKGSLYQAQKEEKKVFLRLRKREYPGVTAKVPEGVGDGCCCGPEVLGGDTLTWTVLRGD